jgi:uncharacterized protein (DUF1778 family)
MKKTETIQIRTTKAEKAALKKMAKASGQTISAFIMNPWR